MYKLPKLPYKYADLEPYISKDIMEFHYKKHHQAYIDKLNSAIESIDSLKEVSDIIELLNMLRNGDVPEDVAQTVRNHGGGHYNHSLFWLCMKSGGSDMPDELVLAIKSSYGSVDNFLHSIEDMAMSIFGSGWLWIMPDLSLVTTPNQDNPIMATGVEPIAGLDIWEHAYYLDYKNVRLDYIKAWLKIADWESIAGRYFAQASASTQS